MVPFTFRIVQPTTQLDCSIFCILSISFFEDLMLLMLLCTTTFLCYLREFRLGFMVEKSCFASQILIKLNFSLINTGRVNQTLVKWQHLQHNLSCVLKFCWWCHGLELWCHKKPFQKNLILRRPGSICWLLQPLKTQ